MDVVTRGKTRPSMAKVQVEVDLLKPLLNSVWVGDEDDDSPLKGFVQKLEYENVPKYYKHCKKLGHALINCRVLEHIRLMEDKEAEEREKEVAKEKVLEKVKPVNETNADKSKMGEQLKQNKDIGKHTNKEDTMEASKGKQTKQKKDIVKHTDKEDILGGS
uniref:Uncharacterized protein n=1 Tax=Nicotiana tabacum TaxID=4097 RepID=A0A1S4D3S1_TOBAC|nr:uncharacterized protein LOC104096893 [Nicotiana tomentosiformis]XP_016507924.1 PREDICTED: uncharacterized protein LOC107825566 [Nicotiana tabacum]